MDSVVAEVIDNKLADTQSSVDKLKGFWDTEQLAATNTLGMSADGAKLHTQQHLERILRRTLCQLASSAQGKSSAAQAQTQAKLEMFSRLIDLSLSLAFQDLCLPDTPYSLFEDLFHLHTTAMYSKIWDLLEERTEALTDQKLFTRKSNMVLLRLANYLLRRVSKANHAVFCGRVMAFLSYAFPLSERSGVNVLGQQNVGNSTKVQTEEEFNQVAQDMDMNDDTTASQEGDKAEEQPNMEEEKQIGKGEEQVVDFTLYKNFWELQQDFVGSPHRTVLSSKEKWEAFLRRTEVVLNAFEGKPFSEADLQRELVVREKARMEGAEDEDVDMVDADIVAKLHGHSEEFFPTKYLSNSRLLKLQLSDPTLRRNVLTQFLVMFQELTRSSVKTMAKVDYEKPVGEYSVAKFTKRVEKLLKATPPDGKGYLRLTQGILEREAQWQKWKEDKCKPFEKPPVDQEQDVKAFYQAFGAKRKQAAMKVRRTLAENGKLWVNQVSNWEKEFAEEDQFTPPQAEPFLEQMFMAIDPDNMIEDAYHPKHDPIYCWRGLRLLYRYKPQTMSVNNLGKRTRSSYNITALNG